MGLQSSSEVELGIQYVKQVGIATCLLNAVTLLSTKPVFVDKRRLMIDLILELSLKSQRRHNMMIQEVEFIAEGRTRVLRYLITALFCVTPKSFSAL